MKISYSEYIKKADVSALVAESIFNDLLSQTNVLKIKDVAKTTSGGTPNRSNPDFYNGTIPWLKSGELNDGIINESEEFISEEGLKNSSAKLHPEGTLLVAMYGATAGKTGILNFKASTNQAVCAIYPNDKVERDYLFWFFRSHRFQFIEKSKGGAQPNISQSVINDTPLAVPSKNLQLIIAKLLYRIETEGTVDLESIPKQFRESVFKVLSFKNCGYSISTELSHQLTLVKKLRQQLLQDAVQGKLVEQNPNDEPACELLKKIKAEKAKLIAEKKLKKEKELPPIKPEEIPFEIPENWVWCRLGEITLDVSYGTSEKADIVGEIPVLRMGNITSEGKLLYSNLKYVSSQIADLPKLYLQNGDLVFNRTNSYELVGKSAVFENSEPYTLASYLIRVRFPMLIQPKFIASYINSKICRETQLEPQIIQQNGQANFNGTKLSNILIPLPPLSEQTRIVQKLDELMQYCNELEASIKQSEAQNEKLLQQVLREALKVSEQQMDVVK